MKSCQRVAQPLIPLIPPPYIGESSALPTQSPTTKVGVQPTAVLSRKSVEVPVLIATVCPETTRGVLEPNASSRLLSRERIVFTM